MRYVILFLILLLDLAFISSVVAAEVPSAKGAIELNYTKKLSAEDKAEALKKVKIKAMDRYFAEAEIENQDNYEAMREKIVGNIDDYILSSLTLVDENDEKNKKYTLVIRIDINERRLNKILKDSATVANINNAEKSMMTFVFVAREKSSAQSFDDKKYARTDVSIQAHQSIAVNQQQANIGIESEHISKSTVETVDKTDKSVNENIKGKLELSQATTTGGSTTRKADVVEWTVSSTQDLDATFTKIFTGAGFKVYAAEFLEESTGGLLRTSAFKEDYRHGDDLSSKTQTSAIKGVKSLNVKYLAIGTLDIGLSDIDPVSGMKRVSVKVTAKILDVSGSFASAVTSIGPIQFYGSGSESDVARTNALKLAASSAATQLVNELNAKSVH